jgi:hypothetical protein
MWQLVSDGATASVLELQHRGKSVNVMVRAPFSLVQAFGIAVALLSTDSEKFL